MTLTSTTWLGDIEGIIGAARGSLTTTECGHLRPQTPAKDSGSLMTTKCGHLRPQNLIFTDRANKTSTVHGVTCDHRMRSLTTTKHFHNRTTEGGWIIQGRGGGQYKAGWGWEKKNNTREGGGRAGGTIQGRVGTTQGNRGEGGNTTRETEQTQKAGKEPGFKLCLSLPCKLWVQNAQIVPKENSYTSSSQARRGRKFQKGNKL